MTNQHQQEQEQQQDLVIGSLAEVTPNTVGVSFANGNGGTAVQGLISSIIEAYVDTAQKKKQYD